MRKRKLKAKYGLFSDILYMYICNISAHFFLFTPCQKNGSTFKREIIEQHHIENFDKELKKKPLVINIVFKRIFCILLYVYF